MRKLLIIFILIILSSPAHAQEQRRATLSSHAIICTTESDIYHLINLFQKQDMISIEKYMRPGKCALTNRSNDVLVLDYVAGRPWAHVQSSEGVKIYTFSQNITFQQN